jgi:hypothetical protein
VATGGVESGEDVEASGGGVAAGVSVGVVLRLRALPSGEEGEEGPSRPVGLWMGV